jgi:zinc D-Ala-D-Ala carboxypeptidase
MNLSQHFTLEELVASETAARLGIDNKPDIAMIEHMRRYLVPGLEQIRALLKSPIHVNSGYRSLALNAAVPGSAPSSQHTKGEAADILSPSFGGPYAMCEAIIESGISFDQIIFEYGDLGWCHISFAKAPRKSVLSKFHTSPYIAGLQPDPETA